MINPVIAEEPDTNYQNARRAHHEYYAPALVRTFWLHIFCAGLIAIVLVLALSTLRTTKELRRAKVVVLERAADGSFDRTQYVSMSELHPNDKEIEHFAYIWATKYYDRERSTIAENYTDSLEFFDPAMAQKLRTVAQQTQWVQTFQNDMSIPETRVVVTKIRLEGGTGPWRMSIDFDKHFFVNGREQGKPENWTAQIVYTLEPIDAVTADMIPVNPIGFRILSLPVETKAF